MNNVVTIKGKKLYNAVIECPRGSMIKYEKSKGSGMLRADRALKSPIPYNYGYFPGSTSEDGDELDVIVLGEQPLVHFSEVIGEVVAVISMVDQGVADPKVILKPDWAIVPLNFNYIVHYLNAYKGEGTYVTSVTTDRSLIADLLHKSGVQAL